MLSDLRKARRTIVSELLRRRRKDVFRSIYERNKWGNAESRSGHGSSLAATERLRAELPRLLKRFGIRSILDAPCGDFHWMARSRVHHLVDRYHGLDIVPNLIEANRRRWPSERVTFEVADLVKHQLPPADLILCRHLLIHLPMDDCQRVLWNFRASGSRYLLITDQPHIRENVEILWTGSFRPLNLSLPPFSLPRPLVTLDDKQEAEDATVLSLYDLGTIA